MTERYVCIHAHFYQPPRENPWLEELELQDSAYPYHDWNERITAECYAPNTSSRILDHEQRIIDIVNNYSKTSFNFGPTLLSWMARRRPEVYGAVLEADRISMERFSGHGSAIAQVYNHMIMPLAERRDKFTQAFWGVRDFEKRFNRPPEGMWLPETAVDTETLEVLAGLGIKFTILSPRQALRVRVLGAKDWDDVSGGKVDPTMAYACSLPSGKTMNVFFYDGPISHDVAFGRLLKDGEAFAKRLLSAFPEGSKGPRLVHIAADGETYGHHQRYGDMALAYCLYFIESSETVSLTNYGEYLEKYPPTHEVELIENSSWSCVHGVERWRDDCGCKTGMHAGWSQGWRRPLKQAMDWLMDRLADIYERESAGLLKDPWTARAGYIAVLLDGNKKESFLKKHSKTELSDQEKIKVLKLLEMQRNSMLMHTSCGWFFDEISGIETVQVMQYAAKAMQYAKEITGENLEPGYLDFLESAPSNVYRNGRQVYELFVRPAMVNLYRVGAHYAMSSLFEDYPEDIRIYCYSSKKEVYNRIDAGRNRLVTGKALLSSGVTGEGKDLSFAALHFGDQNISCGVQDFPGAEAFASMEEALAGAFERGDVPAVIRLMDRHFPFNYTVWHLFKDEQRRILGQILSLTYEEIENSYRHIYAENYTLMNFFHSLHIPVPRPVYVAAEYIVNLDMKRVLNEEATDVKRLERLIDDIGRWSIGLEKGMEVIASTKITSLMKAFSLNPEDASLMERMRAVLGLLKRIPVELDLWEAQNFYFSVARRLYKYKKKMAGKDDASGQWLEQFRDLGRNLKVRVE